MAFSLYLLISLPLQLYLFLHLRRYVRERFAGVPLGDRLIALNAFLFLLMLIPWAWRAFVGNSIDELESWQFRGLYYASSIWGVGAIGCALILFVYNRFPRVSPNAVTADESMPDPSRRHFLKSTVNFAAAAPFAVSGYGVLLERRRFVVERFYLPVAGLGAATAPLSIVHLTDLHVGPFMSAEELSQYVNAVNELKPDLIALTGDFVTSEASEADTCADVLAKLRARLGVFACIGNHEIYARADERLAKLFASHGIRTLRNDGVTLETGAGRVSILGIDDLRAGRPNLAAAQRAVRDNPGEIKILLSHRPEIFPAAALAGIDTVLSGHYHGGQVKLFAAPESFSVARLLTPYAEGPYRLTAKDSDRVAHLFVARGIGTSGLPIRVNCPPQIAHLTLTQACEQGAWGWEHGAG